MKRVFLGIVLLCAIWASQSIAKGPDYSPRPVWRPEPSTAAKAPTAPVDQVNLKGDYAYVLMDLATGQIVDQKNSTAPFAPASVTKSITALYALEHLGADYRFYTDVYAVGAISNGVLNGDLVLVGTGDPMLDTDDLADLVRQVKSAGITRVNGRFIFDGSALPELSRIDENQPVYVGYNPGISGLNLNFNRVYFDWAKQGKGYRVQMDARGDTVTPLAQIATMKLVDRAAPLFDVTRDGAVERWSVATPALGKAGGRWLPVRQTSLYTAQVFQTLSKAMGVDLPAPVAGKAVAGTRIARFSSDPLHEIIRQMLLHSTNPTAEILGLTATRSRGLPNATLAQSAQAMTDWAKTRLAMTGAQFRDHSGLGDDTHVSGSDMIAALTRAQSVYPLFETLLKPIKPRTPKGDLDKSGTTTISAKTGTLNFVSALAGYLHTTAGKNYAFAILTQNLSARSPAENKRTELPAGASAWNKKSHALQFGLLYRWARLADQG